MEKRVQKQNNDAVKRSYLKAAVIFLRLFIAAYILAFLVINFIIINAEVPSASMMDTIDEKDWIIGSRITYLFSEPQRGDIIIFYSPDDETRTQIYVKRIIGVPGDVIAISNGTVYMNGEALYEAYIKEPMLTTGTLHYTVPSGSYFVLGDNRNNSNDSRYWESTHYVKADDIIAKYVCKYRNILTN